MIQKLIEERDFFKALYESYKVLVDSALDEFDKTNFLPGGSLGDRIKLIQSQRDKLEWENADLRVRIKGLYEDKLALEEKCRNWAIGVEQSNTDIVDMQRDEFKRIIALLHDPEFEPSEIKGICERAIETIEQTVPVVVQRDKAEQRIAELKDVIARRNEIEGKAHALFTEPLSNGVSLAHLPEQCNPLGFVQVSRAAIEHLLQGKALPNPFILLLDSIP